MQKQKFKFSPRNLNFHFFWLKTVKAGLPIPKFSTLQTPSRFFKVVFCQYTGNVCTWLLAARQEVTAKPEGCILGTVVP